MEFKRMFNSFTSLSIVIIVIVTFIFGYVALLGLDGVAFKDVTVSLYMESLYSTYIQLGLLLLPFIIVSNITTDYVHKNIVFYRLMGKNYLSFIINKFVSMFVQFEIAMTLCLVIVCLVFQDFSLFGSMLYYLTMVIFNILLISTVVGFLCKNALIGFIYIVLVWIVPEIIATINENLKFLTYYDSPGIISPKFMEFLHTQEGFANMYLDPIIYSIGLVIVGLVIITIFKKRWDKNGI